MWITTLRIVHVQLADEARSLYRNLYNAMVAALIKLRDVCNALVPANSTENEALIGWPHLRRAREVWPVATTDVCFRHAHVAATFLTIKLITHVFLDFPSSSVRKSNRICLRIDYRGKIDFTKNLISHISAFCIAFILTHIIIGRNILLILHFQNIFYISLFTQALQI